MTAVAITGLGSVASCGHGRGALELALRESRVDLVEIDRDRGFHLAASARHAARAAVTDLSPWLAPAASRRMSPPSRLAAAAARMALEDANLAMSPGAEDRCAVFLATGYGPSSYTERILEQVIREGPSSASPMLFTESVANAPAAQVALLERATGANVTVTQLEAGALHAVARGAQELVSGRADRVLAGAVEELSPLLHAILDRYHALVRPGRGGEVARPFDRRRSGYVAGEGAAVLVLERAADAAARGAETLANLEGWSRAFDPSAPPSGWGERPERTAAALKRRLERAGFDLGTTDLIVSGANGSRRGDRAAGLVLRSAFRGATLPPVVTPAAMLGAFCGNTLGAAVLAARGAGFGPTPGFEEIDPDLGIRPHDGSPLPLPRRVLVESTATGGAAVWLALGRPA
ncbi:MAG TPA: beta-ketoacyl synthase N-terminal-like domain-containing protein [Thermoanaerobaculia bacterium]|nr:beta-ketoacyl synthase N-terminal-like domain-containing protein [Thermoanaerobaculia bacterium]